MVRLVDRPEFGFEPKGPTADIYYRSPYPGFGPVIQGVLGHFGRRA
jgi:hypothetical protein